MTQPSATSSVRSDRARVPRGTHAVASHGPKVLRVGVVREGRVIEERIIKDRTHVTVGGHDKNTFVVFGAELPPSFRLFEVLDEDYCLNFDESMQGRLALPGGACDLQALRSRQVGSGHGTYQVRLSEESRGKITVGDTTFLFQFVAPPPEQPRPQLPVSVTRGATAVDWTTTVIAAFSFLAHFCAIAAMYSDWLDPVVDYEVNVGALVETVRSLPAPPPVEEPVELTPAEEEPSQKKEKKEEKKEAKPTPAPKRETRPRGDAPRRAGTPSMSSAQVAAISNELESLEMATLAALTSSGPATANVLRTGEVPTATLDAAAKSAVAVSASSSGGLKLSGSGGTIRPGATGGGLASIGSVGKTAATGSGTQVEVQGPKGDADVGEAAVAGGQVGNADRVVASLRAGFRACYNRGLATNPDIQGKILLKIKIGPTGEVLGVTNTTTGDIPPAVVSCVEARAKVARFQPPEGGVAVVQVPVSFVKQ